jgi:hypothetical protein
VPIFVAEGAPMRMIQATTGSATVGPVCKILIGSAVTGEIESYSAENAATIVGRILSDQVGRNLDRLHAQLKFRTDR